MLITEGVASKVKANGVWHDVKYAERYWDGSVIYVVEGGTVPDEIVEAYRWEDKE